MTPPPRDSFLSLSALGWTPRQRGARPVLTDVSLDVPAGSCIGLLGSNGSGKSSILRSLLGLVAAEAGALSVSGTATTLGSAALRAACGVVFQAPSLDGKLTVQENLQLGARLQGLRGAPSRTAVAQALQDAGLVGRAHDRAERLSGGLKRRVELVRAEQHRPQGLLLDEPTQGLDAAARVDFWRRIAAARAERGLSVLVATHDADEAARCDRLYLLRGGRVVACDTPAALLSRVARDVVVLAPATPGTADALAARIAATCALPVRHDADAAYVSCQAGHEWVPRLVEAVGPAALHSLQLRKASLSDVFAALTGDALGAGAPALSAGPEVT